MGTVFLNGCLIEEEKALVPALDRGFLSGDGIFTTLKVQEGQVHFLNTHLKRLEEQCKVIKLQFPDIKIEWIEQLIEANNAFTGSWKMKIVMSGGSSFAMRLPDRAPEQVLLFIKPYQEVPNSPLKFTIFPEVIGTYHARVKSLAHLNRFCMMESAIQAGFDDTLTTTEGKIILEASFGNICWKEGNTLYAPDPRLPLYFGVTATKIIECAQRMGLKIEYVKKRVDEIAATASVFRCNSMTAIRPIIQIENRLFERDPLFERQLMEEYEQAVQRESLNIRTIGLLT